MTKLVVGCIAVTAALVVAVMLLLVMSEPEQPPRFTTLSDAIENGAEVLAADSAGAVTLTANGKVRGFSRDGAQLWERSYKRFEPNKRALLGARATCVVSCPSALIELPSGYEGVGGADPAGSLARTLTTENMSLLGVIDTNSLFASAETANGTTLRTVTATDPSRPSAPTLDNVGIPGPGYVGIAREVDRGVVGSIGGDPPSGAARVRAIDITAGSWTTEGPAIPEVESANICISPDGRWIGIASTGVFVARFGSRPGPRLGPRIARGTCAVDTNGISSAVQQSDTASEVVAQRYSHRGKLVWRRQLGAVKILSDADAINFVARSDASGATTVLDAITGEVLLERKLPQNLFAADDGSLVTADRSGRPSWIKLTQ